MLLEYQRGSMMRRHMTKNNPSS